MCLFVLLPITAYSQMSFYQLRTGKSSLGLGFTTDGDTQTIAGSLDYGIERDLKMTFTVGVALTDDSEYGGAMDIPPSPIGVVSLVRVQPLGETDLDYFGVGSFSAGFARGIEPVTDETLVRTRATGLSAGAGILKRLKTESGWILKPFFGLYYSNVWLVVESDWIGYEETETESGFSGEAGMEIEISSTTSIFGSFGFSFESSSTTFSIGARFY